MAVYKYTDKDGKKHEVAKVRVSSLDQIQEGDHICFNRIVYWHHAIVEDIEKSTGKINVIEFTNGAEQFIKDNSIPPKAKVLAKVDRGHCNLQDLQEGTVYVIKHEKCLDPGKVVSRARNSLGRDDYHLIYNNCEHFALWCKTETSFSEQISNVGEAMKVLVRLTTKEVVTQIASHAGQEVVKTGARLTTKEVATQIGSGLLCAAVIECLFVAWDVSCAHADKEAGTISNAEFKEAVKKRIMTGAINAAVSSAGAAIGQLLIPVPVLGGVVGGILGSCLKSLLPQSDDKRKN